MTDRQFVLLVILGSGVLRVVLAGLTGLGVDEFYMAGVSRQLALSYFDHPPLHVWLVGLWAKLTGSEFPLILRLPFIVLFAGSTWLMFRLAALVYGERAGLWAVLAFNLAPVFTLSTASWVLPDGPLIFFMLLGAFECARLLIVPPSPSASAGGWVAAGVAGGAAMLSKYLGAFLFAGIGLFLLTSLRHRRLVASPGPWIGVLVAALMFAPVILWNADHGWASFAFQGGRGAPQGVTLTVIGQNIGGQLGYLLPWIAIPLLIVLVQALRRGPRDTAGWFFACLAIGPIALFTLIGFWTRILPHWPMVGWLFTLPLLGQALAHFETTRPRILRQTAGWTAAVLVAVLAVAASQAATGWVSRAAQGARTNDPTIDLFDWRTLAPALAARGMQPGMFVATTHWIEAGKINYAVGKGTPVLCLCSDARHFAYLHDRQQFAGRDAIIVSRAGDRVASASRDFASVEPLPDIILERGGIPAVTLKAARGTGFRP